MASANMQHVVGNVGSGNEVGDHREAVCLVCSGSALDIAAIDERDRCRRVGWSDGAYCRNRQFFVDGGNVELKVNYGHCSRNHGHILAALRKALAYDSDGVVAQGNAIELKLSRVVRSSAL